jgi:ribose 5-phosphate isomerase B
MKFFSALKKFILGREKERGWTGTESIDKVVIASDHRGMILKERVIEYLKTLPLTVVNYGVCPHENKESVDYPDYAKRIAEDIADKKADRGILICGTGIGMAITANRYDNIRAAVCDTPQLVQAARKHNDLNILCLGANWEKDIDMKAIIDAFLSTPFEGGRHTKRLKMIDWEE